MKGSTYGMNNTAIFLVSILLLRMLGVSMVLGLVLLLVLLLWLVMFLWLPTLTLPPSSLFGTIILLLVRISPDLRTLLIIPISNIFIIIPIFLTLIFRNTCR